MWRKINFNSSSSLYEIADKYVHFQVEGKIVQIPYCIVRFEYDKTPKPMARTTRYKNYAGKGTVDQIRKALIESASREKFNLKKATSNEITKFMITQGIGIDCSGFVFNILDQFLKANKKISLTNILLRYPGFKGRLERLLLQKNRVRRINAATLTNNLNTIKIEKVSGIKPGDILRLTHSDYYRGKHVALVVKVRKGYITYANSSEETEVKGPHFAKIKILNPHKGLDEQKWLEITQKGVNYQKYAFDPKRGDSVRRLYIL